MDLQTTGGVRDTGSGGTPETPPTDTSAPFSNTPGREDMTSQEIVKSVTMCWVFVQQDTYLKLHTADCKKYVVVLTIKVAT